MAVSAKQLQGVLKANKIKTNNLITFFSPFAKEVKKVRIESYDIGEIKSFILIIFIT